MINSINNNLDIDPSSLKLLKEITNDSYALFGLDNSFCIFTSINNTLYLVYSNINYSIIAYNLINNFVEIEIKKAHNEDITNLRHFYDRINNTDLILSISFLDNNLKVWDLDNWDCLLNINNINSIGNIKSACFLYDNNQNYIISSSCSDNSNREPIKVFDLNGNKIKEINDSYDDTIFIDTYYDKNSSINYILTGNNCFVKSYNYNENKVYHKYFDEKYYDHTCIIINNFEGIIKLIESSGNGYIRIWNFHSGELLNKIQASEAYLYCMCLWNNDYLFVGSREKAIILIEIKSGTIIKKLKDNNKDVVTIKKINHPQHGECLITQGKYDEQIKLWINDNI
jgi:hypothetical protein